MAPVRPQKRKSPSPPSTSPRRTPIMKKRKVGITLAQKQALIDNLQLEITERARRLRAQYNIQAQQLRSRVEMRVNRIPTTLRKIRMEDVPKRIANSQRPRPAPRFQYVNKPPLIPAKDGTSPKPIPRKPLPPASPIRGQKRLSTEISGADKENQGEAIDNPKKRLRGAPTISKAPVSAAQILSPTSSNTRVLPRERPASPTKPMFSRPASPMKAPPPKASSNILSSIVEKAKGTRPTTTARKATTSSTASSSAGTTATTATGRTRKAAAPPPSTTTTRGKRKVSVTSESSEGSTATVVKKTTTTSRTTRAAPAAKRTMMNTIKSATTKKAPAAKAAPAAQTTGRTLRKRA
ncbi:Borealin N terminal-domain-containing protein [Xylaria sp. FL0064]|nr:Borealin N terminal-domain-containing protein [Xylaria sp. FL0064]